MLSALQKLEDLGKLSETEFTADPHKVGSAKYNLIVAIEGTVDLSNHIISKNGFRTPEDYADTFRVMEEKGIFDTEFTSSLIQMARFRNRLFISIGISMMQGFTALSKPDFRISDAF